MIKLRIAKKNDCQLLFEWANEKAVRQNSFNTQSIDYHSHTEWFYSKLNNENTIIFIITKEGMDVGQIRIDIKDDVGIINYSIDYRYRGQGIGTEVLIVIREELKNIKLVGYVKKDNKPSLKAFEKAGYYKKEYEEFIEFISSIEE